MTDLDEIFEKWMNEHLDISSTLNLILSLKIGLSLLLPPKYLGTRKFLWDNQVFRTINRETLSLFFGHNKSHDSNKI